MYIPIAGIDSSKPDPKPERPETTPPVPMSYPDIQTGAWYHDAVSFVHSKSLMSGFDDGSFRPEASTTRGMVAAVLYRLDDADTPDLSDFQDVKPDAYYANAVAWGASNGIISGYSADIFGPDDPITRLYQHRCPQRLRRGQHEMGRRRPSHRRHDGRQPGRQSPRYPRPGRLCPGPFLHPGGRITK